MDAPLPPPSPALLYGFLALLGATLALALLGVRRAGGPVGRVASALAAWLVLTGALASSGVLARWELRPPPMIGLLIVGLIAAVLAARGRLGARLSGLPFGALVGFQAFRFPLELLLHRAYVDGLMPVQMSFEGRNLDIITGLAALGLGLWSIRDGGRLDRRVAWAFNVLGLALLINIMGVAIAATPVVQAFGPDDVNRWVTDVPFVWLPMVFVTFALFGHLVLTRRLLRGD